MALRIITTTLRSLVAGALIAPMAGCASEASCPPGTVRSGGACVSSTGPGAAGDAGGPQADGGTEDGPSHSVDGGSLDPSGDGDGCTPTMYYTDEDGDGYGDESTGRSACAPPSTAHVAEAGDCDDANADVYPGAPEQCNEVDDDCDGSVDEEAAEAPVWYRDADGDGYGEPDAMQVACSQPSGYVADGTDCNDLCADCHPGAEEICDGENNDCDVDDEVDEDFECIQGTTVSCTANCGTTGEGTCTDSCTLPGASSCTPPAETCNYSDDDCDGVVDNGVSEVADDVELAATGDASVKIVARESGFVAVYDTGSQLRAQRFDADGRREGASVAIASSPWDFDAARQSDELVVTWLAGGSLWAQVRSNEDLSVITSTKRLRYVSDFASRVRMTTTFFFGGGFSSSYADVVYDDGGVLKYARASLPSLGSVDSTTLTSSTTGRFDVAAGTSPYLAFQSSANGHIYVGRFTSDGFVDGSPRRMSSGTGPHRDPALVVHSSLVGSSTTMGLAWASDGSETLRMALIDWDDDADIASWRTEADIQDPAGSGNPIDLTYSGGRWVVSSLWAADAYASRWYVAALHRDGGSFESTTVIPDKCGRLGDACSWRYRSVSIASADGRVMLGASRNSTGADDTRAMLYGCP